MYEIVFGGFNNLKHTIRTRKNDNNYLVSMTEMAGLLSCTEYKSFWITWKNFHIIAGTGQTIGSNVLLEYNDTRPDPFIVRYIGISTWYGVIGQWIFRNEIPTFSSLSSSTVYAKRGESVVLCCASVGIPVPVITWHRDGVNMSNFQDKYNITNSGYLTIHNFEKMDSGLYICTATNSEGDNSFDVHVHCCGM
ncbi:hypothetical protein FSP39_007876 [Pinctada imbricata]|uniref:Ig-like domain-containing protein n=1 Tax=Pinctada imbricata TaxID=66713 RepID=A0AA88XLJ4_PINIB|nr:hypothetical protein FSP39_007876 [Pinctada imbricata]